MHRTPEQRRAKLVALGYAPEAVAALAMGSNGPRTWWPGKRWDADPAPHRDEYESERLGAAELGVGRFHDGRGL